MLPATHPLTRAAAVVLIAALTVPVGAQTQTESEIDRLTREKQIADLKRDLAVAEKDRIVATQAAFNFGALQGTASVSQFTVGGMHEVVGLAEKMADRICKGIKDSGTGKFVLLDPGTMDAVSAARLLEQQIDFAAQLVKSTPPQAGSEKSVQFIGELIGILPDVVNAVLGVASLFKTNVKVDGAAVGEAESLLVASMGKTSCKDGIVSLSPVYMGQLAPSDGNDTGKKDLVSRFQEVVQDLSALDAQIKALDSDIKSRKKPTTLDARIQLAADEAKLADMKRTATQVGNFVNAVTGDGKGVQPVIEAERYLRYFRRVEAARARILAVSAKAEALTIVKESKVSQQTVRLSAAIVGWYQLFDADGTFVMSDTFRGISKPRKLNLRDADGDIELVTQ